MNTSANLSLLMLLATGMSGESLFGAVYKVVDLGPGVANDINNLGHVVGSRSGAEPSDLISSARPFFYNGVSTQFVTSTNQFQYGINPITQQPLLWDEVLYTADGINDLDHISGITLYNTTARGMWAYVKAGETVSHPDVDERSVQRAVLNDSDVLAEVWSSFDGLTVRTTWEFGINASGLKAGSVGEVLGFRQPQILPRAALVLGNQTTYIEERPPLSQEYFGVDPHLSDANAVNNAGHVVGVKWVDYRVSGGALFGGSRKAFLYKEGSLQLLGTLGGTNSAAQDINAHDQVVGSAQLADGKNHAFLWENGQMIDLNTRLANVDGWVLTKAAAINDKGSIVGAGIREGVEHAFLLVPDDSQPVLAARNYVGISISGKPGATYRIEYQSESLPDKWVELKTVLLEASNRLVFDEESPDHARRIYRAVLVP